MAISDSAIPAPGSDKYWSHQESLNPTGKLRRINVRNQLRPAWRGNAAGVRIGNTNRRDSRPPQ